MDRRKVLSTSGAAAVAALAGCATGGSASSSGSRTVFSVAQPMLPIAGTSEMFPVRRIYCIGRNYAAPLVDNTFLRSMTSVSSCR